MVEISMFKSLTLKSLPFSHFPFHQLISTFSRIRFFVCILMHVLIRVSYCVVCLKCYYYLFMFCPEFYLVHIITVFRPVQFFNYLLEVP